MNIGIDCLRDVLLHSQKPSLELSVPKKAKKHWSPKFPLRLPKMLKKAKSLDSHTQNQQRILDSHTQQNQQRLNKRPTSLIPRCHTLTFPVKPNLPGIGFHRAVSYSFENRSPVSPWGPTISEQYTSLASINSNISTASNTSKTETAFQRLGRQCPLIPTPTFSDYKPSIFESIQEGLQGAVRVGQSSMTQALSQTVDSVKDKCMFLDRKICIAGSI